MVAVTTAPDLGAELLATIARLNRWATRQAELPIPPAQARLLAQIDELGAARIGDLARADHCSQPTLTTHVQRLEERGWVNRVPDPEDGRAVRISLTARGATLLRDVRRARAATIDPLVRQLDSDGRRGVEAALVALDGLLAAAARADREISTSERREISTSERGAPAVSQHAHTRTPDTGRTTGVAAT